jgi:phage-related tail fiber protein
MSNTLRIKRRAAGGAAGAPSSLQNAELAFNEQDNTLYYGKGTGGAGGTATQVLAIGGPGAFVALGGSYADPDWLTSLDGSKITGNIAGNAGTATKLATARSISLTGDGSWTINFDGSASASASFTLAASGVTAGTYKSVTVDAKGRVTGGTNPSTLAGYGITDAQPLDADLTAIAAITGTSGLLKKTGADTWTLDTNTYLTSITSSMVTAALGYTPEDSANKGIANGYASLDGAGKVPSSQLPSFVDDVKEYADLASFPATGETDKIYVAIDTNKTYRWGGSTYVEISASPGSTDAVPEGSVNQYFTQARARQSISVSGSLSYNSTTGVISFTDAVTSVAGKTGAVTLVKGDVGLGNVENTALSTWAGSTNITTLGTVGTGTWNGSTIGVAYGGTGATSLTGLVKGNGTSAMTAAVAGTDYLDPNSTLDGGTF